MEYTLRNPKASDLFLMGRIISKIGVKNIIDKLYNNDNVKELIANSNGDDANNEMTQQVGVIVIGDVVDLLLDKLDLIQNDLYDFIGALSNLKSKEVANMEIDEFLDIIVQIIKLPKFKDFMKVVLKSFK